MNNKEFTAKCLRWQDLQEEAAEIAAELEAETLTRGKTQTVGDVRVTFSQPRKQYDYEWGLYHYLDKSEADHLAATHTKTITTVDYRAACKEAGLTVEGVVPEGKQPSAKIKLIK